MFSLSEQMDRHLVVLWVPNHECGARFEDIFISQLERVTVVDIINFGSNFADDVRLAIKDIVFQRNLTAKFISLTRFFVDTIGNPVHEGLLVIWTRGTHTMNNLSCDDYLFSKSYFYRSLQPVEDVAAHMTTLRNARCSERPCKEMKTDITSLTELFTKGLGGP